MKKIIAFGFVALLMAACSSKKEGNMIVQGQIIGLKKGTLYFQKVKDTTLISVDSVALLGTDIFTLTDNVNSPEMYYLTFDGNTTNKYILFFGEKGTITINDHIDKFGINPKITGSKNQQLLDDYNKIAQRFNEQNLDLIKAQFMAQKSKNKDSVALIDKKFNSLAKRRYLFTANFAINNAQYEVAPYLALSEISSANLSLLDTINKSLSAEVKASKYGKKLGEFLSKNHD